MKSMPIAILGAGDVGARACPGCLWALDRVRRAHPVSEKVTAAIAALKGKGRAAHNEEAVQSATVVALCVPWPAAEQAIRTSSNLTGKIVIDGTNPVSPDLKGSVTGIATSSSLKSIGCPF